MKLNLGCGTNVLEEWENIDIWDGRGTPVEGKIKVIDLEQGKLPYETNGVDQIKATHVLEHIRNLIPLMNECHRVLKKDGEVYIEVPNFPHPDAVKDPTHVRFFVPETLEGYFCRYLEEGLFKMYGIKPWRQLSSLINDCSIVVTLAPIK